MEITKLLEEAERCLLGEAPHNQGILISQLAATLRRLTSGEVPGEDAKLIEEARKLHMVGASVLSHDLADALSRAHTQIAAVGAARDGYHAAMREAERERDAAIKERDEARGESARQLSELQTLRLERLALADERDQLAAACAEQRGVVDGIREWANHSWSGCAGAMVTGESMNKLYEILSNASDDAGRSLLARLERAEAERDEWHRQAEKYHDAFNGASDQTREAQRLAAATLDSLTAARARVAELEERLKSAAGDLDAQVVAELRGWLAPADAEGLRARVAELEARYERPVDGDRVETLAAGMLKVAGNVDAPDELVIAALHDGAMLLRAMRVRLEELKARVAEESNSPGILEGSRDEEIYLDPDDIAVVGLPPDECEDCEEPATHQVMVDFRAAGFAQTQGGNYCEACAISRRDRIRDGIRPALALLAPEGVKEGGGA